MDSNIRRHRWVCAGLLATLAVTTLAPAASAGHARYRYKSPRSGYQARVVTRYCNPGSVYTVRHSSAGPAIAGFLGGLFLGATIANAAPAGYGYYDPYCHSQFASLEVYRAHLYRHHHPRVIRVIALDSGDCVRSYRYSDGGWNNYDDGYGGGGYRDGDDCGRDSYGRTWERDRRDGRWDDRRDDQYRRDDRDRRDGNWNDDDGDNR
jgi:hypothetical protein